MSSSVLRRSLLHPEASVAITTKAMTLGALRVTRIVLDGRNRFTKVIRLSQAQKRNARARLKLVQENAAIIREGKAALDRVNARIMADYNASQQKPLGSAGKK